jgi:hypothetical protein
MVEVARPIRYGWSGYKAFRTGLPAMWAIRQWPQPGICRSGGLPGPQDVQDPGNAQGGERVASFAVYPQSEQDRESARRADGEEPHRRSCQNRLIDASPHKNAGKTATA